VTAPQQMLMVNRGKPLDFYYSDQVENRGSASRRRSVPNMVAIKDYFVAEGEDPTLVELENVTLSQQVALFSKCRVLVAQHGAALANALDYIAGRPEIWEVILTGGDPLVLSTRRLGEVMERLGAIEHVKVIRLHSRVPAVAPERITGELIAALKASGKTVYVALHANHPRELSPAARAACARLVDAGLPMLSQTVLLRGVNDDAMVLAELMRGFVETRIKPYYLHLADLAPGTAHLRVPLSEGQAIVRALRGRISGLCQPTFVLDIPGGAGKSPVGPSYLSRDGDQLIVEDPFGGAHAYP